MQQTEQVVPPARTKDIVTRDMPDEVLVYDLKTHKAHCLNQTAATVWKYCDGQATVAEIVMQLKNDLNLTIDEATVWLAVERLSRADLLVARIVASPKNSRLGRREAIRRLGLGTAITVPMVMSVIAPTAQAACSITNNGATCTGTLGVGSSGVVPDTICCSQCCTGRPGVCVSANTVSNNSPCTRDCQCISNNCVDTPGSGGTCRP